MPAMKYLKKIITCVLTITLIIICGCQDNNPPSNPSKATTDAEYESAMHIAETTPLGRYPEQLTYTLGKLSGANNSNLPQGETYENNAYTQILNEILNVQNQDIFEAADNQYDDNVSMVIAQKDLPDVMIVQDMDELQYLVENDMIEDLTDSYNNCMSETIKNIYKSYGSSIMDVVTFDDRIMAIPETNISDGPNLIWLRKDWMDKLGLSEPHTIDDVVNIVKHFISEDPGNNGVDASGKPNTVGLAVDTDVTGECGYSSEFLLDIIFACFGAYPKQWIMNDDGEIVYGSVTDEAKEALSYINSLYNQGVIDNDFLLRTSTNICELIENGLCGSFFGPWWAPNNPLANAVSRNPDADWQPYLIATDSDGTTSYHSQNPCYKYVVVRKGYEHPEIAAKMISVMFDKVRFDCTDSEEFKNYYQLNVEPTARPLSINVDYNNALSICYRNIDATISGRKNPDSLELLERSFYDACSEYIKNANKTSTQWAAYMSRIKACSLIAQDNIKVVDSLYFKTTDTMKSHWWRLKAKEKEAYLKIISGEEDISYFDTFVKEWNEQGGQTITSEVSESMK